MSQGLTDGDGAKDEGGERDRAVIFAIDASLIQSIVVRGQKQHGNNAQHEHLNGQIHHMRVQVGEEKTPERELVDGVGNDAAALPVVEAGDGSVRHKGRDLPLELAEAIQVADHGREIAAK